MHLIVFGTFYMNFLDIRLCVHISQAALSTNPRLLGRRFAKEAVLLFQFGHLDFLHLLQAIHSPLAVPPTDFTAVNQFHISPQHVQTLEVAQTATAPPTVHAPLDGRAASFTHPPFRQQRELGAERPRITTGVDVRLALEHAGQIEQLGVGTQARLQNAQPLPIRRDTQRKLDSARAVERGAGRTAERVALLRVQNAMTTLAVAVTKTSD